MYSTTLIRARAYRFGLGKVKRDLLALVVRRVDALERRG
jgi:hypothetical protein